MVGDANSAVACMWVMQTLQYLVDVDSLVYTLHPLPPPPPSARQSIHRPLLDDVYI